MQSNEFRADSRLLSPKKITFWVKLVVFSGLLLYILHRVRQNPAHWSADWQQWQALVWPLKPDQYGWLAGLVLLAPVNWGFEALKWQLLIRRVEPVRYGAAYRGVLAGLSLGFVLPTQVGDTTGRVLSLRSARRGEAVGASLVSGGLQFLVALLFGALAWTYQLTTLSIRNTGLGWLLAGLLLALILLALGAGAARKQLINRPLLHRYSWTRKLAPYWQIAGQYTAPELLSAFGAAVARYLVFSFQFYLVLRLYGIDLPAGPVAAGIGLVFLAKTITPAFNLLSDLGVREAAALWVFSPYAVPAPLLLTATLTLWLTNVLLPVLVGLIWVWQLRITTK